MSIGAHNGSSVPGGADALRGDAPPRNGHDPRAAAVGVPIAAVAAPTPVDGMGDALERERARLEAEIAAAVARTVAATHREEDTNAALHAVVVRMQERLTEMETRHTEALAAIRTATDAEVARIVADAARRAGRDVHPATTPIDPPSRGAS